MPKEFTRTWNVIHEELVRHASHVWNRPRQSDADAERFYLQLHGSRLTTIAALVDSLALGTNLLILDVGIHVGFLAHLLRKQGHRVLGLEKLRPELPFWTDRYEADGVDAVVCDLATGELPFCNQSFDLIVCSEVIEHLPYHPDRILNEFRRTIRPEGKIIITTPNSMRMPVRVKTLLGKEPTPLMDFDAGRGTGHFREYSSRELAHLFHGAGLEIERLGLTSFRPGGRIQWLDPALWSQMPFLKSIIYRYVIAILKSGKGNEYPH